MERNSLLIYVPESRIILPVIVLAQFCCTSVWFAGNAVMPQLVNDFHLNERALGHLTSAVQFGFITGTLVFALFSIADRISSSKVFFISAFIAAAFNLAVMLKGNNLESLFMFRFLTGFFLAGIYPVGMKIAADYFQQGLGKSLGFLVGALVVGTAFPHLLNGLSTKIPWRLILMITSALALTGGILMILLVPNGPFRKRNSKVDLLAFFNVFKNRNFRSAAFGYFGHMWELYAFWTFVPFILMTYLKRFPDASIHVSLYSFLIIGSGGLACVLGGYLSKYVGTKKTAGIALFCSGFCCLISPLVFMIHSTTVLISFLVFWGIVVVADSPLFSTLVANNTEAESKGTALTIVNCIGFSITIISIQLLNYLRELMNPVYLFLLLSIGPVLGLYALFVKKKEKTVN